MRLDQIISIREGEPKPLYVQRKVLSVTELENWARDNGLEDILRGLHATQLYSNTAVVWSDLPPSKGEITVKGVSFERFGDATVIRLDSPIMQERHAELLRHGASHDYNEYLPHITISYDPNLVIENLTLPDFEIDMGEESFEGLGDDNEDHKETRPLNETFDLIATPIRESIEKVGNTVVQINPNRKAVEKMLEDGDVRGFSDDRNIYTWSANAMTHAQMGMEIGVPRETAEGNRFHIFAPWEEDHDGADDWRGAMVRDFGDYQIAGPSVAFRQLDQLSTFNRWFTNRLSEGVLSMPFDLSDSRITDDLSRGFIRGMKGVSPNNTILHRGNLGSSVSLLMDISSVESANNLTFNTSVEGEWLIDALAVPHCGEIEITVSKNVSDNFEKWVAGEYEGGEEFERFREFQRALKSTGLSSLYGVKYRVA